MVVNRRKPILLQRYLVAEKPSNSNGSEIIRGSLNLFTCKSNELTLNSPPLGGSHEVTSKSNIRN